MNMFVCPVHRRHQVGTRWGYGPTKNYSSRTKNDLMCNIFVYLVFPIPSFTGLIEPPITIATKQRKDSALCIKFTGLS